ncbi:MAG: septation ring formation regulator EzrA [Bacilli bacterium]|nr:septation ring formation regulator EzrA [Bacilli bacterium]
MNLLIGTAGIGIIIGASVLVVLVGLGLLLNFTVFAHNRLKTQVRELSRKFEYLHALLFGQDSQFVKRLEIISRTNLVFVEIYQRLRSRFKEIIDKSDAPAQNQIDTLKDLRDQRNFKELKEALPKAKEVIAKYESDVNLLTAELTKVAKPEEECRQEALVLKEELRRIKQEYYTKQADLTLLIKTFDILFSNMEKLFEAFETHVESAHYDEAKAMLPQASSIIHMVGKILPELPDICVTIQTVIPDKLVSTRNRFQEMHSEGYPLQHLRVGEALEQIEKQTADISSRLQEFKMAGIQNELSAILAKFDYFQTSFDKEKEARVIFERECGGIYEEDNQIDKRYIKLCNTLPDVKRIFVVTDEEQSKLDLIKNQINKAGATKRSLDTFIHSGTKQPYTMLVEKMHVLQSEADQAMNAIIDFERYLMSLKEDTESALSFINDYYLRLKDAERMVREISVEAVTNRYQPACDEMYRLLDEVYKILNALPIKVAEINSLVAKLKTVGEELVSNVNRDYKQSLLAETAIVFSNRDRQHLGEVDAVVRQTEGLYLSGDFLRSYEETLKILRRIREGDR